MDFSARFLSTPALVGAMLIAPTAAFCTAFDECGSFECDGNGCLIFRTDAGISYELIVPGGTYSPEYTPDHRACVTGTLDCTPTCNGVVGCVTESSRSPWHATTGVYSTSDEFVQGQFLNLNATTMGDQLQMNDWAETKISDPPVAPYIWVTCSKRGTVVRIATEDHYSPVDQRCVAAGDILGQYYTDPTDAPGTDRVCGRFASAESRWGGDPSRTTVDYDGSVWVANREDIRVGAPPNQPRRGHVVKIGSGLAYQWVDRNANGVLDTSRCGGEICDPLPWSNQLPFDECSDADVAGAVDELILRYHVITPDDCPPHGDKIGTRTVAVDRENNVWVGGKLNAWHEKLDGQTATTIPGTGACFPCGGYESQDSYEWHCRLFQCCFGRLFSVLLE